MPLTERHILFIPLSTGFQTPSFGNFLQRAGGNVCRVNTRSGFLCNILPPSLRNIAQRAGRSISILKTTTVVSASKRLFQPGPLHNIPSVYRSFVRSHEVTLKMYDAYKAITGQVSFMPKRQCGEPCGKSHHEKNTVRCDSPLKHFAETLLGRGTSHSKVNVESASRLLSVSGTLANDLERILGIRASNFTQFKQIDVKGSLYTSTRNSTFIRIHGKHGSCKGHRTLCKRSRSQERKASLAGDPLKHCKVGLCIWNGRQSRVCWHSTEEKACEFFQESMPLFTQADTNIWNRFG